MEVKTVEETSKIVMKLAGQDTHMRMFYEEYKKIKAFTGMKIFVVSFTSGNRKCYLLQTVNRSRFR